MSITLKRAAAVTLAIVCALSTGVVAQERGRPPQPPTPPESLPEPQGFLIEPDLIERAVIFGDRHLTGGGLGSGFKWGMGDMIPGAGWISAAAGYRHWGANDRYVADGGAVLSWRGYRAVESRFEMPQLAKGRFALGTAFRWQDYTQIAYFGQGPASSENNISEYRLRATNLVGYATWRPVQWIGVDWQLGWLDPTILPRSGSFMRNRPETQVVFAGDRVFAMPENPTFVTTEVSLTADTRDFPGHTLRGSLTRVAATRYSDRDTGLASFNRYDVEGAQFIPLAGDRIVVAAHGRLVASETADGAFVPFYLQPTLGGGKSLRSFSDYRFQDRNLLVFNIEARVAMMTHVDAAFFVDAGNVAPRIGDLNLDKRSYGAGLRLHSRRQTFARLDFATGAEGWRIDFGLSDPLQLSRLTKRAAVVPLVP